MRVLVMMSGGVDSSVAAVLLRDAGHEITGVTLKLWGGPSDSGCCSISDVDDARRVADRLGIDHHSFNFADEFGADVVAPYIAAHAAGETPNPCIECNRHLKFDAVLERARRLGFDAVATGHHARIATDADGRLRIARGADPAKDQSYVLHMLAQEQLARVLLPIGDLTKDEVRTIAADLDLRTATKPDSQDVCFITKDEGRAAFLSDHIPFTPAEIRDRDGSRLGTVTAVELVTHGQRRGLGLPGGTDPRYVVDIDRDAGIVTVGNRDDLLVDRQSVGALVWSDDRIAGEILGSDRPVLVQTGAHATPTEARLRRPAERDREPASGLGADERSDAGEAGDAGEAHDSADAGDERVIDELVIDWCEPRRRIAPGQSIVFYDDDRVLGGGIARRDAHRIHRGGR